MSQQSQTVKAAADSSAEPMKMLGALVPENLYWEFKAAAGRRKEYLQDAIAHAARMYIDADKGEEAHNVD